MIGFLLLGMQQAVAERVVDTATATNFQTTAETQPMILYYNDCLFGGIARGPVSANAEAQARARIAACAETRKWVISTGVRAYRSKPGGDPDAAHYLNTSLDQVEQGFLAQARFADQLMSGEIKPSDLKSQPVVLKPDGTPDDHQ